jgi:molybdopterin molybdotransferase
MGAPLSVEQARAAMLAHIASLPSESVTLAAALRRVLAQAVTATRDQPPFAVSAMDGYAIRAADVPGTLRLIGESAAGAGFDGVCAAGEAVCISTGAAIPVGADAVVIQEDVRRDGGMIVVSAARVNANIRPQAGDFRAGVELLAAGRRLDGVALSLAAAAGRAELSVVRRPRITLLCSGDELVPPGATPGRWQIFESASIGIAALVESWGGVARKLDIESDDVAAIARAAADGLRDSDLLVVIGGASVGDHDHARPALARLGLELKVEKVAVRPGKPTWFGITPQGPVLGLPGNPASALACAHLFARPLLEKMLGRDPHQCVAFTRARLVRALPANGPREHYLRAWLQADGEGRLTARAFEDQDSSLHSIFAAANALIRLPPDAPALPQDAVVDVLAF